MTEYNPIMNKRGNSMTFPFIAKGGLGMDNVVGFLWPALYMVNWVDFHHTLWLILVRDEHESGGIAHPDGRAHNSIPTIGCMVHTICQGDQCCSYRPNG